MGFDAVRRAGPAGGGRRHRFTAARSGRPAPGAARRSAAPRQPRPVLRRAGRRGLGRRSTPGSRATLRNYVRLLRRSLAPEAAARLVTRSPGYVLEVADGELDLTRFAALCAEGRDRARSGDWPAARERLAEALALWRGPAFTDVAVRSVQRDEVPHLAEQRSQALEWRVEADLLLGRHEELIGELQRLVDREPLREKLREQLMLSLYRAGRQGDALAAYRAAHHALRDELGVEPGPGLRELHRRILAADPSLIPSAHTEAAPAQLPLDVRAFAGRDADLARLDHLLEQSGAPVTITAVSGTAGVGKTALAVHWAHRAAARYPDGQLSINLRGFDPASAPLEPAEALRALLEAVGVPARQVPAGLAERSALFRSTLADRRVLLLLDNAHDDEQVRPLLPGSASGVVLVTSRNQLHGLAATEGARPVVLDVLDPDGARAMLAGRIGADRVKGEPEAVDRIIERCAGLPLALAVVAARAVVNPGLPLRAVADALGTFTGDDPVSDVRGVLSWSYQDLTQSAARVFRLLGLHPGPDVGVAAASGLAGHPARAELSELTRANLLTEHRPGRYGFHDLLRAYARSLAVDADDVPVVTRRMLDHYLHTAFAAALRLRPHRDPIPLDPAAPDAAPESPADRAAAMAWFGNEDAVLRGLVEVAAGAGFDGHVWRLAWAGSEYFERQGKWHEHVVMHRAAVAAASRSGDQPGLAYAYRGLGLAHARLTLVEQAERYLSDALAVYRRLDDRHGQARTHNNLGWLYETQARYPDAIAHAGRALALYRDLDHRPGQANALNNIGWYHALDGDFTAALGPCEQALAIHVQIGDVLGQAATLDSLGYAQHRMGDHRAAIGTYRRAVDLFGQNGSRFLEATTQLNLGDALAAAGECAAARSVWQRAADTLTELGHPDAAKAWDRLSSAEDDRARPVTP